MCTPQLLCIGPVSDEWRHRCTVVPLVVGHRADFVWGVWVEGPYLLVLIELRLAVFGRIGIRQDDSPDPQRLQAGKLQQSGRWQLVCISAKPRPPVDSSMHSSAEETGSIGTALF